MADFIRRHRRAGQGYSRQLIACLLASAGLWLVPAAPEAATVTVAPAADTTIYQGIDPGSGENFEDNSCGAGPELFSGVTADGLLRRGLLRFDVAAAVPPGSTINSVELSLLINRSGDNQVATMSLHPLQRAWGEGMVDCSSIRGGGKGAPANPGDATWLDAAYQVTPWTSPGADYTTASAVASIGTANGDIAVWSSAASPLLTADVQGWLDNPASNHGWIVVGDEARVPTARRFLSREGGTPPQLEIDFTPLGDVYACCFTSGDCSIQLSADCTAQGGEVNLEVTTCEPNPCTQPVGACCNLDESCSDMVNRLTCERDGGSFQGSASSCSDAGVDCGLTPFIEDLPIPPVLQPTGTRADGVPQYTVEVVDAEVQLHSALPATPVWTYNGAYPSYTIEAVRGQPLEVTYINSLPTAKGRRGSHLLEVDRCAHGPNYYADSARIVTHLHGGHLPARFDGQPEYTLLPGEIDVYEYPNDQDAATLWYHDHALGITRLNVYAGMAGFYLLRDSADTGDAGNAFGLPSGEYEIPIVIQDREFNPDGTLFYNPTLQDAFKGNRMVVNGKVWPYLDVRQGKYRLRLLNGSQSRQYSLRLENLADPAQVIPFTLIGTDLGLVDAPLTLDTIDPMVPAERFDVIVDFSGFSPGTEIVLRNDDLTSPRIPNVMKFVVGDEPGFTGPLPASLRAVAPLDATDVPVRYFRLTKIDAECSTDPSRTLGEWLVESLDGPGGEVIGRHWDDLTDFPVLGSREIWEFENPGNAMHPMHVHLVRFQILDKTDITTGQSIPLKPWEINTWKDIVEVPPRSRTRIIMDFEDYLGKFAQHCHILDHEDHEMMRQFQTVNDPAGCDGDGFCEPGEDCIGCSDCSTSIGSQCGNGLCEAGDGENCVSCAADCAGKLQGGNAFCCGFDDGEVTNPIACGAGVEDDRCINAADKLFCRMAPRVEACCGDALCEGAEDDSSCSIDCSATCPNVMEAPPGSPVCGDGIDNDCDGLVDLADLDCVDSDGDGVSDFYENNILQTDPNDVDTDRDGLVDGYSGVVLLADYPDNPDYPDGVSTDGIYVSGEQTYGADATEPDTDGDRLDDALEVTYGSDPADPASWPNLADGDVAPYGAPDGSVDAGDLVVGIRLVLGLETITALELAHLDMGTPNSVIDLADIILQMQLLLN